MCKLGVCEWCLPVNSASAVEIARKAGFDGLQLSDLGGAAQGFPMNNPHVQESYLRAASDYGIELQSLHPYGLQRDGTMLFPLDTPQGASAQKSIEKCVDACADMHIPNIMLSSFFATLIRNRWEFDVYAEHLKRAVQIGRDKGVRVVYECILDLEHICRMLDIVGPELKLCYDLFNPLRYTFGSPEDVFKIGLEHIDHFHIKDAPSNLKGYVPIGEGCGNIKTLVSQIIQQGYDGWFVSENYYTLQAAENLDDFLALAGEDVATLDTYLRRSTSPSAGSNP